MPNASRSWRHLQKKCIELSTIKNVKMEEAAAAYFEVTTFSFFETESQELFK